jgi:DNA-binding response OmpR family regulator
MARRFGPIGFRVLRTLAENRGKIVRTESLISAVYGNRPSGGPTTAGNIVKVTVCHLRKIVGAATIETVWGVGYRLREDAHVAEWLE